LTRTVLPLIHWPEAFPTEWFDSHEQVTHFVIHRADNACVARRAPSDYQKIIGSKEGWSVIVRTQRVTGETPAPDSALDSPSDGT